MIYYKKKLAIKRIVGKNLIKISSCFLAMFLAFLCAVYLAYLFLLPVIVSEKNVENIINSYLTDNTKLSLDIENLKISPDFKFDINLKADSIKLNYSKDKNFLTLQKPVIDVNILTLFFGYLDLNRIKTQKIEINTNFTKTQKYSCFDYFDLNIFNKNTKFQLRNTKINADEFLFTLFDENVKKNFYVNAKNLKFVATDANKPVNIQANGVIRSSSNKIADFNLKFEYKIKQNVFDKFKDFVSSLNYNPLMYADKFAFKSDIDINLKVSPSNNKNNISGKVDLKNYSFALKNMRLPSNNLSLIFDGQNIKTDCNFNFIKNQFIKIKSNYNYSNAKILELALQTNEINLSDFKDVALIASQIFNIKTSLNEIALSGILNADFYIKTDFNTINSKGQMNLIDSKLVHKKTGLVLSDIDSRINFENNKINILNTTAYVDKSKFYLSGTIDDKTNLDIKINSDLINMAQVINLVKSLPLLSMIIPLNDDCNFKSGLLKINASILGSLKKPVVKTNSKLENLSIFIKSLNLDFICKELDFSLNDDKKFAKITGLKAKYKDNILLIPEIFASILDDDILISKTYAKLDGINTQFEAKIRNYKIKDKELNLSFEALLPSDNKLFVIKGKAPEINAQISYFKNNVFISKFDVVDKTKKIITLQGGISNLTSKDSKTGPNFNDLKVNFIEKTSILIPKEDASFEAEGEITFNSNIKSPDIACDLKLSNVLYRPLKLYFSDMILNIRNSYAHFDIKKGKILDTEFDLNAQGRILGEKIVIDFAQFYSPYVNFDILDEFIKQKNLNSKFELPNLMILSLKGNVSQLNAYNILLNNVNFDGAYRSNALHLNKFSAELFNGIADGSVVFDFKNYKTKLDVVLKQINARLLASQIKDLSIAASGKISALVNIEFSGFEYSSIQRTLQGYVKFNINDGELAQFAKLERLLQAGNILSQSILKLTLNSAISAISKQNTGYFKTIEGTLNIKDSWANIQYMKIKGPNMSMYLEGKFNIISQIASLKILGRIPLSTVNVLGNIGRFSIEKSVDNMSDETKGVINTITASPVERMMSVEIPDEEINKIPLLENQTNDTLTREFVVKINGLASNKNSVEYFKWRKRD